MRKAEKRPRRFQVAAPLMMVALTTLIISGLGCSTYIGTTATSFLRRVHEDPDPNIRYLAYSKLANPNCFDDEEQKVEAVQALGSTLLEEREPPITRALICRTLGEIGRPEAREPLLAMIDSPEPVIRAAACRALGKIGTAEDAVVLSRLMVADQDPDCRIAAIEGIGALRSADDRIVAVLVDAMESNDPAIRLSAYEAIQRTTGQNLGPDPKAWRALVESQAPKPSNPEGAPASAPADEPEPVIRAGFFRRR